jgi:flagellar hook-length control protein FliK
MSAMGLVSRDAAGLSALIARKTPAGGSRDDDPDADFSAALAQTADASPASQTPPPAAEADTPRPKGDDVIWRTLAGFSDEAKAPKTAVEADALQSDLPGVTTGASSPALDAGRAFDASPAPDPSPALEPSPALDPKPARTATADTPLARVPPKPDARPASAPASVKAPDAALARPLRAASSLATVAPEKSGGAPIKMAAKPEASSTNDRAAAPKAAGESSTLFRLDPPPARPEQGLVASALPLPAAPKSVSAPSGPSADQESVARIGAALTSPGARSAGDTLKPAASDPRLKEVGFSEAASKQGTTTAVHVVAQQTWLPPVSPLFSPGLNRQVSADRAALETPLGKTPDSTGAKDAAAVATESVPGPLSAPEETPPTPFASLLPPGANLAPDRGETSRPAAVATPASTSDDSPRILAAPRKDLEITLAPKELGGLELRMKSAGDRLELAFVADRGETARLISDQSAALTSQLHDAGLGLGGIDISAAASNQGGDGGGRSPNASSREQDPAPRQDNSGRERQDRKNEKTNEQNGDARPRGERGFYL